MHGTVQISASDGFPKYWPYAIYTVPGTRYSNQIWSEMRVYHAKYEWHIPVYRLFAVWQTTLFPSLLLAGVVVGIVTGGTRDSITRSR